MRNGWVHREDMKTKDEDGNCVDDFVNACKAAASAYSSVRHGIIAAGGCGSGKTAFIQALTGYRRFPYFFDMNDRVARECLDPNGGYGDEYAQLFKHDVVIDDLGAELRKVYGESDFTEAREFICEYHVKGRGRLFITTNLSSDELRTRYGERLFSRLKDLTVPLRMFSGDKRKWRL